MMTKSTIIIGILCALCVSAVNPPSVDADTGGPDASPQGYRWLSSGPTTADLTYPGDIVSFANGVQNQSDWWGTVVNIGFTFNFYGVGYTQCWMNSRGVLEFGGSTIPTVSPTNTAMTGLRKSIAVWWDDLVTNNNAAMFYSSTLGVAPNRYIVLTWGDRCSWWWCNGYYSHSTYPKTAQNDNNRGIGFMIVLWENGLIECRYNDTRIWDGVTEQAGISKGASATIGLANEDGSITLQRSFNPGVYVLANAVGGGGAEDHVIWFYPNTIPIIFVQNLVSIVSASTALAPGVTVPMISFEISATANTNLTELRVDKLGNAPEQYITSVMLYKETNGSAGWQIDDTLVSTNTFTSGIATIKHAGFAVPVGVTKYYVVYQLSPSLTSGLTVGARVGNGTAGTGDTYFKFTSGKVCNKAF